MKMIATNKNMRKELLAAMAAAYQEHLDEAAQDPAIRERPWDDFFSPYCPAPDDDALIHYFNSKGSGIAQGRRRKETGGLSH
jgi:hypothetical protein